MKTSELTASQATILSRAYTAQRHEVRLAQRMEVHINVCIGATETHRIFEGHLGQFVQEYIDAQPGVCQACGAELHHGDCPVCDPWEEDGWDDD